jgi:hypothetical protein
MSRTLMIGLGILLTVHGLYSIYVAIKGGPLQAYIGTSDYIFKKILGENNSNSLFNLLVGLIETFFGILLIIKSFK